MSKEREALEAIEHALRMGFSPATVLDENSPIRDGIRAALASPAAEPVQAHVEKQRDVLLQAARVALDMLTALSDPGTLRHRGCVTLDKAIRAIEADIARPLASPPATKEAKDGWIPVDERMPEPGTECIVWVKKSPFAKAPYAALDTWDEQHDAPLGWSSATIPVGLGWGDNEFEDVSHWMPLPPAPEGAAVASLGADGEAR